MNQRLQERFDRLESTRRDALSRLEGHDRGRLNHPRSDGGWSALQVLHHVISAEAKTLGYTSKKMRGGSDLPRAGLLSRLRLLALQVAMVSPLRFKAPAATANVPAEIDPAKLTAWWDEVRAGWEGLLESFPDEILDRTVFRHPFAGLMGLPDTLGFMQAHFDHHTHQVDRALGTD